MFKVLTSFLTSLLLLSGCASDVATDYSSGVNFAAFNTYQYQENAEVPVSSMGHASNKPLITNSTLGAFLWWNRVPTWSCVMTS